MADRIILHTEDLFWFFRIFNSERNIKRERWIFFPRKDFWFAFYSWVANPSLTGLRFPLSPVSRNASRRRRSAMICNNCGYECSKNDAAIRSCTNCGVDPTANGDLMTRISHKSSIHPAITNNTTSHMIECKRCGDWGYTICSQCGVSVDDYPHQQSPCTRSEPQSPASR